MRKCEYPNCLHRTKTLKITVSVHVLMELCIICNMYYEKELDKICSYRHAMNVMCRLSYNDAMSVGKFYGC